MEKIDLDIKTHTLIYTVGPSGSGKSTFCKDVLIKQVKEKYPRLNVQYISSDDIRRDIIGESEVDFNDIRMVESSQSAFKLLETRLECVMKYDIRAEIIIVDTTGIAQYFRDYLDGMAHKNHYEVMPIIFNYKNYNDYTDEDNKSNRVTTKQLKRFRLETLSSVSKRKYPNRVVVKSKQEFNEYNIKVNNYDSYLEHFLDGGNYVIISDIHGCLTDLKSLIVKEKDTTIEDGLIKSNFNFIVQDYIDKGPEILETIEFVYNNWKAGKILPLLSNHENFVYKSLKGFIDNFEQDWLNGDMKELLDTYFNSYHLLKESESHREMFFELFENSKEFYSHDQFFINHAPCSPKYLGKIDPTSLRKMRNFTYDRREENETIEDFATRLKTSLESMMSKYDNKNYKHIIWGHVSIMDIFSNSKKSVHIIDTGCVSGGKLTSASFGASKVYFRSVDSSLEKTKDLPLIKSDVKKHSLNELESREKGRILYMSEDKINFIMPTMSPSDKYEEDELNQLESLSSGLSYFKDRGVDKVMLQKKYMGSNAQVYLFKDVEKCYTTSRNGYLIKSEKIDLTKAYESLIERLTPYMNENGYEMVLLSAELMPWATLGAGLIDRDFRNTYSGFKSEFDLLLENNFHEEFEKLKNHPQRAEYEKDFKLLSSKDLSNKYGNHLHTILKSLMDIGDSISSFENFNTIERQGIEDYNKQLELFGNLGDPYFLPFSILKGVRENGSEDIMLDKSNVELFNIISDDEYLTVDLTDDNYEDIAYDFYNRICMIDGMEGVVIKPIIMDTKGVVPFMKVRNPKYLTITYGYDYKKPSKFNKLIKRKSIKNKLRSSFKQWEIAKEMLRVPYKDISKENNNYIDACIKMVIEEKYMEHVDPRL